MARPPKTDRASVADSTLTLRLTREERDLLDRLVELRAGELANEGGRVSAASLVRGLIRSAAKSAGLNPCEGAPRAKRNRQA